MKRYLATLLAVVLALSCFTAFAAEDKPDTWIADRTITIQCYVDDIGYALPNDINSTPVMQKITELTGIKLDLRYTPGDSDATVMAAQLAAGNIPDAIVSYLNNSTRPEFPILLKAAKEGLFADLTDYLPDTQVYCNYLDHDYLPADARDNITFRKDLDGAYIFQLNIAAVDRSTEYVADDAYIGGLYIRSDIAADLGVEPFSLSMEEELYDLAVKIKEGNYTDDNGNPIYPIGPKYWGGSYDSLINVVRSYGFSPFGSEYGLTTDGQIVHEAQTNYVFDKINYTRKLLAEGLMHPEFFTMDTTRCDELCRSKGVGIISDVHNYMEIIYSNEDWIPLGKINDVTGSKDGYTSGKGGYGCWAISADAQNPEEILKFFDFLVTHEGKLLSEYGIEGLSYNLVDGYPVLTEEAMTALNDGNSDWMINEVGAGFGGAGLIFFDYMTTNNDNKVEFGESRVGAGAGATYARSVALAEQNPDKNIVKIPGLDVSAYLSVDELADVKANMDLLNYKEMVVQAIYADSDEQVNAIVESFRAQLKAAGIDRLYDYCEALYAENPETIQLIPVEATVTE
ncbi:MAG: extracellular solute-binding protein [Clostridia bacterium]|nr:extracellular solute-binding protein [Clostridia bacterium]